MRDLYILLCYMSFLAIGTLAPFVFILGYVWVDTFYPQAFGADVLKQFPISQVMAIAGVAAYAFLDRRSPPRITAAMLLTLFMAFWVTATLTWAVAPDDAWLKWDWAFKTILFSAFIPFFIRSRVQIEAFLQVYLFAASVHIVPVAIKTLVGGSSYGRGLGLLQGNSGLSESSTLSAVCIMLIPILLSVRRHSIFITGRAKDPIFYFYVGCCCIAAVSTYARTALVGFVVVATGMLLKSRHKFAFALVILLGAGALAGLTSSAWNKRISTVETYQADNSAYTRILVWTWTLGFVAEHPFGGGFDAYRVNRIETPGTADHPEPFVQYGRAFHSIYFELLGEQGWLGLGVFLALVGLSLHALRTTARQSRDSPELDWCRDLAGALQVALLTLLACAAFIGIAFQPMFWYLFAMSTCLRQYVRKVRLADLPARLPWQQNRSPSFATVAKTLP